MFAVLLVEDLSGETYVPTVIATAILPEGLEGEVVKGRAIYGDLEDAEHAMAIMERDFSHCGATYLIADANSVGDWVEDEFVIDSKLDRVYA